jgi:hypothetical protein
MPAVAKLDFVSVPSQDAERARAFYGETLDTGVCHMALFRDPDGNDLLLHHRYAPYA